MFAFPDKLCPMWLKIQRNKNLENFINYREPITKKQIRKYFSPGILHIPAWAYNSFAKENVYSVFLHSLIQWALKYCQMLGRGRVLQTVIFHGVIDSTN